MPLRLTRKESESIVIFIEEKEIRITVEEINSKQVSLIFDGPEQIEVWRDELFREEAT